MSRFTVAVGFVVMVLLSSSATAQTSRNRIDFGVGYQVLHIPDETYPFGLNFDAAGAVTPQFDIVGEFGWARDSQNEAGVSGTLNFLNLGGGPRWSLRSAAVNGRSIVPYLQVLAGAVHADANIIVGSRAVDTGTWAFMLQPGAGISVPFSPAVAAIGQVDYRRAFFESGENEFRFVVGVRIGAR